MQGVKSAEWETIKKSFVDMKPLYGLISLPAGDGNFQSSLCEATTQDLATAISVMQAFPEGNASRLSACQRRLNDLMSA